MKKAHRERQRVALTVAVFLYSFSHSYSFFTLIFFFFSFYEFLKKDVVQIREQRCAQGFVDRRKMCIDAHRDGRYECD